ncbi:MAG: hypothetical protein WCF84_08865, partial [Anaerolineae bacterium]
MPDTIVLSVDPARVKVNPGEQVTASIAVRNRSEEVGEYTLRVEGAQAAWATMKPAGLSVFPMQTARAQIVIYAPPDTSSALYELIVRAVSSRSNRDCQAVL